jgi:hypothetical protein
MLDVGRGKYDSKSNLRLAKRNICLDVSEVRAIVVEIYTFSTYLSDTGAVHSATMLALITTWSLNSGHRCPEPSRDTPDHWPATEAGSVSLCEIRGSGQ